VLPSPPPLSLSLSPSLTGRIGDASGVISQARFTGRGPRLIATAIISESQAIASRATGLGLGDLEIKTFFCDRCRANGASDLPNVRTQGIARSTNFNER